jgi:hypothetical protein
MSAKKTLRLMNTEQPAALRTGPPFPFVFDELPYTELPHILEIVDHTHAILGPVSLIKVIQPGAGKPFTAEAVPDFSLLYLLAVFDFAVYAGFWFVAVVAPAAGACVLISCIGVTETTVHTAGSDQHRADRICLCRFF